MVSRKSERKQKGKTFPLGGWGVNQKKLAFYGCKDFLLLVLFYHFVVLKCHPLNLHRVQPVLLDLACMVPFPFHFNSCAWCSVRSSLHTSGAHLNRSALWCYRYGGNAAPLSPRRWAYATIAKNIGACLVVSVFRCKFATAIYSRKTHTSTFNHFMA